MKKTLVTTLAMVGTCALFVGLTSVALVAATNRAVGASESGASLAPAAPPLAETAPADPGARPEPKSFKSTAHSGARGRPESI